MKDAALEKWSSYPPLSLASQVTSCSRIHTFTIPPVLLLYSQFSLYTVYVDIFCDEDGTREFSRQCVCPACQSLHALLHALPQHSPSSLTAGETELHGQFDITKVDLHPSEQYKSVSQHQIELVAPTGSVLCCFRWCWLVIDQKQLWRSAPELSPFGHIRYTMCESVH